MINNWYEKLKIFVENHRKEFIYGACFIAVFLIGYGTGQARKSPTNRSAQQYSTTKTTSTATKPKADLSMEAATKDAAPIIAETVATAAKTENNTAGDCTVKGNARSKIYHVKGGAFYATLKDPTCFATEAAAKAAGYRKSGR